MFAYTNQDQLQCAQVSTINLSQVQTAHERFQSPHTHRRYWKSLRIAAHDGHLTPKPLSELKRRPETSLTSTHRNRANAAIQYLKSRDIHFEFASQAELYIEHPDPQSPTYHHEPHSSIWYEHQYVVPLRSNLKIDSLESFDKRDRHNKSQIKRASATYGLMSVAYGGLHLVAWSYRFPTNVEMWMWRGSGLVMVGAPICFGLSLLLNEIDRPIQNAYRKAKEKARLNWFLAIRAFLYRLLSTSVEWTGIVPLLVTCICVAAYPVARTYVFVEAFAALRACDKEVYRTVEWTNFIPHAG